MKDVLLLLVLLTAQTLKVSSQPYQADSGGNCQNQTREYIPEGLDLCCKRCPPGQRLNRKCSVTTDSDCKECNPGQYIEAWNYNDKCFTCTQCKTSKGLQYARNCSSSTNAKCVCQPGMYCIMGFNNPYCTECRKYKLCKVGEGVYKPGSAKSNVVCKQCPNGTFSDTRSYTDRCKNHTSCNGRAVVKKGDAISDTVCEQQTTKTTSDIQVVHTNASTTMSTVALNPGSVVAGTLSGTTQFASPSVTEQTFYPSKKGPTPSPEQGSGLVAVVVGVIGLFLLFIFLLLLCLRKQIWRKDSARLHTKVDANGNCESGKKINPDYLGESQLTSFTVTEQQCLLENGGAGSEPSQSSHNTETLTRTDDSNSHDSIGPLQSTVALDGPDSAEPLTLHSNMEQVVSQPCALTQSSSQPTSPQVISPHVNVNITLNIGNGPCGTPSFSPATSMQKDSDLPFGEEEESISTPQQEDGKCSLMSVREESSSCST